MSKCLHGIDNRFCAVCNKLVSAANHKLTATRIKPDHTRINRPTIIDTIPGPRPLAVCVNPACSIGLIPERSYYGQWLLGFVYADMGYGKMAYYPNKKSGYICDECAANYRTLTDKHGNQHQVCVTEIKPETKWEVGRFK